MKFLRKIYHILRRLLILLVGPTDFYFSRKNLISDGTVSEAEIRMLEKVYLPVHRNDGMYVPFEAREYLSVGLSAIHCIERALEKSNRSNTVRSILDFPCGYGRVLRFLQVKFPNSAITVSEIDSKALDFCNRAFSVNVVPAEINIKNLSLQGKFDLIWCGSLITHIHEGATIDLLNFFYQHLAPGGLCVYTTQGRHSVDLIQKKLESYGLTERAGEELLSQFHAEGYGYADYKRYPGYGISVVSHERMQAITRSIGNWKETSFLERGWDDHQDVYGYTLNAS